MNILVLCTSPNKGGLELYAHRSTKLITGMGNFCISVINKNSFVFDDLKSINKNDDLKKDIFTLTISNHILPLYSAYKLAKIIDDNKIGIVHIHWSRDFNLAVFAKIFCKLKIKLVYTRHMAITRYKNDLYHKFLYSKIDCFIAITQQLEKEAKKFLPLVKSRVRLLYHGISLSEVTNIDCGQYCQTSKNSKILNIAIFGRIEAGKGQHLVIDAIHKLNNKNIQVTIIGHVMDNNYNTQIKSKIESYHLTEQFHFHHFIENAVSYMKCFDVIVLPTYSETFGLVLIEAMLSGVAVIGSNSGGVPEIINNKITGLLFDSKDSESLANKIKYYYDNPKLRKEIATQGQRFVEINFSEQQHVLKLEKIFKEIR